MIQKNIRDSHHDFTEIVHLYANCFGRGDAAQLIDNKETEAYFSRAIAEGGTCATYSDNNKTIAALLYFPARLHTHFPPEIIHLVHDKSIYIAELMVDTDFRGRGLARKLIHDVLNDFPEHDFLIRVWRKNEAALQLYLKTGFTEVATITETKTKPDGNTLFEMEKVYLHFRNNK